MKALRAMYQQIARVLNWLNGTGSRQSGSEAIREAEDHRRAVETRSGGGMGGWDP